MSDNGNPTFVTNHNGNPRPTPPPSVGIPVESILQFFDFDHLPPKLKEISRPFGELAVWIVSNLPRNPERTVALRKLLESKDAAVRSAVTQ